MGGITGTWNLDGSPIDFYKLNIFIDTLSHRGPDGRGMYIDPDIPLALGHRRLAIFDKSEKAFQPMSSQDKRFWITYNGEIYNFIELRKELESYGYNFVTNSDTEVILSAFDKWGIESQFKFNGMWAFAIWDEKKKQLFISRDRFGVKPLYYYYDKKDKKYFAFASEIKSFLALPWFDLIFNQELINVALKDYVIVECLEETFLTGVSRLLPGHCLTLSSGKNLFIERWWNTLDHLQTVPPNYCEQVTYFKKLFIDACKIRMRNDVPTASCLSGGLDSSSVFCSIMKIKETVVPTEEVPENSHIGFVASYMNDIDNEVEYAKEVITHTKSTAYYFEIDQCNLLNEYFDIIYSYENISDIHIGPWLLFKKMRDLGIYVSIDGHGGDELLAGYPQYINSLLQAIAFNWHPVQLIKNICRYLMIIDGFNGNKYKDNKSLFYNDLISSLILVVKKILNHPVFFEKEKKIKQSINPNRNIQDILTYLPKSFFDDQERIANKGLLFRQLYLDYHYFLLPTNLRDFDLLSMAHGVEVRSPFLDWRLVCFVFSLQEKSLIDKSFTKRILRDSMKGILPDLVRMRRAKGGFANPHASWKFSVLDEFIMSNLTSHSFKEYSNDIWPNIIDDYKDAINTNNVERLFSIWQHLMSYWLIKIFKRKRDELIYVN